MANLKPQKMYGGGGPVQELARPQQEGAVSMPVSGGRSSVADDGLTMAGMVSGLTVSLPEYPFQFLDVLEMLGKYHADVSFAADNVVQLSLTKQNVYFSDAMSSAQKLKATAHLKAVSKNWYSYSGGKQSLVADLIYQAVINGALSAEIIPKKDLSGVDRVVLVPPKSIRFQYQASTGLYFPYQQAAGSVSLADNGLHKLNPVTYKYLSLRRSGDRPYGIPPFMAALDDLARGKDMLANLSHIVKKFGAMGFVEALLQAPAQDLVNNESLTNYYARLETYLQTTSPRLQAGMKEGIVVGFKGGHEFKYNPVASGNAINVQALYDMNDVRVIAGLKQDPFMVGRNTSTTETLGRVILAKFTKQVGSFQNLVEAFLTELYSMELLLAGIDVSGVSVEFDPPMLGDQQKEETARSLQIANLDSLYNQGIISQQDRANELGYDEPFRNTPLPVPAVKPAPAPKTVPGGTDPAKVKKSDLSADFYPNVPVFPYNPEHDHLPFFEQFGRDEDLDKFVRSYFKATKQVYTEAVAKSVRRIVDGLANLAEGATMTEAQDRTLYLLLTNWDKDFSQPQKEVTRKWLDQVYGFFRKDVSPFAGKLVNGKPVPAPNFDLKDYRTLEYLKSSDNIYLGKFITDPDTKQRLLDLIRDEYLAKGLPAQGQVPKGAFEATLGNLLLGEEWKIQRVIATTMNKARNYGAVNYMGQADVERFIVRGVNDSKQCRYCSSMNGRTFTLSTTLDRISKETNASPAEVRTLSPFITSVFKKPENMESLSDAEIQKAGVDCPSFHPSCRCVVVADL